MKQFILLTAFFLFNSVFSQDIIGTWKVKEIIEQDGSGEMKKMVSDIFLNSEFTFATDKKFQFVTPNKSRATLEFTKGFSNTSWILDSKNQVIKVGSKKDNYSILNVLYKEIDGIMYFQLHEFNYIFKMEKVIKE